MPVSEGVVRKAGAVLLLAMLELPCAARAAGSGEPLVPIVPRPALAQAGEGAFDFAGTTAIVVASESPAAARTGRYLDAQLRALRPGLLEAPLRIARADAKAPGAIVLRLDPGAPVAADEGYTLDVDATGVTVRARGEHGLFNGAISLLQWLAASGAEAPVRLAAVHIEDQPRFSWRGLMLDSARHMQTPEEIKAYLDAMALHKLNVLQWHLTDDQGWRLQVRKYPRLTEVGAWREPADAPGTRYGGFYTQEQVREIVRYAAERYITVVPEIDLPGHAQALVAAYPQFGNVAKAPPVSPDWGVHEYLVNVEPATLRFIEDVLAETLELFPSKFIHVGGDEALKTQWKNSPAVQRRMRELGVADEAKLQAWLTEWLEKYLAAHGRRLIGWDEILEGGLPAGAAVMSWRGVDGAIAATKAGHDSVLTPWPLMYFDNRQGTGAGEPPGRIRVVSLEDVYRFDPLPPSMSAEQGRHLLGVQANVWTEHIRNFANVGWMSFPRAAAIAEMGWTPGPLRDWDDFHARLPALFRTYELRNARLPGPKVAYATTEAAAAAPKQADPAPTNSRRSVELKLCSENIAIGLDSGVPGATPLAVDLQNPCWIFEGAELGGEHLLQVEVATVPFNFQIGELKDKIVFPKPRTPEGELVVTRDSCEGEEIARIPLATVAGRRGTNPLLSAALPGEGRHDLCLRFAQPRLEPVYIPDRVEVALP